MRSAVYIYIYIFWDQIYSIHVGLFYVYINTVPCFNSVYFDDAFNSVQPIRDEE